MSTEDTSAALTIINEAIALLQRFTASVLGPGGPDLDAQLSLASASTSAAAARDALEVILPTLKPPPNPSPERAGSLPHDVLAEIFKAWFHLPDGYGSNYRGRSMAPCYVAASVNRHWRAAALTTPSIWTRAVLDLEATANIDQHLSAILSRSKKLPLDVRCCHAPSGVAGDKKLAASLIDKLVDVFSRCARLSISWSSPTSRRRQMRFEEALLPLLQVPMPDLESLTFEGLTSFAFFGETLTDTRLLTLSPKLRDLDLGALPLHYIEVDSMRLRSFRAKIMLSGDQLSQLNEAWSELTALDIYGVRNGRPLLLPELRTLKCSNAGVFRCIPSPAHAPRLELLSIGAGTEVYSHLDAFLSASACASLCVLEIRTGNCPDVMAQFTRLFPALPGLRELRLVELDGVEVQALFKEWNHASQQPASLETISLRQSSLDGAATRALVNFLARRKRETGRVLPSLSLVQQGRLHDTYVVFPIWMRHRFEQLVHDLQIDVHTAVQDKIDP